MLNKPNSIERPHLPQPKVRWERRPRSILASHTTRRPDGQQHLRPGPAPETPKGKIPRISRLMALAIHCHELLRTGQITNQSELASYAQITPARMTQILTLLNLDPDIQDELLFLPRTTKGRSDIQEKNVRKIAMELDWNQQRAMWTSQ